MGQLSRFLGSGEEISFSFRSKYSIFRQTVLLILLLGLFFMLWPLVSSGRQGFFIWLSMTAIVGLLFIGAYQTQVYYFVTNKRILAFLNYRSNRMRLAWEVNIDEVINVSAVGVRDFKIITMKREIFIKRVHNAAKIFRKLKNLR